MVRNSTRRLDAATSSASRRPNLPTYYEDSSSTESDMGTEVDYPPLCPSPPIPKAIARVTAPSPPRQEVDANGQQHQHRRRLEEKSRSPSSSSSVSEAPAKMNNPMILIPRDRDNTNDRTQEESTERGQNLVDHLKHVISALERTPDGDAACLADLTDELYSITEAWESTAVTDIRVALEWEEAKLREALVMRAVAKVSRDMQAHASGG